MKVAVNAAVVRDVHEHAAFDVGLLRMPNRARSLAGAARAHAAAGHREIAAERYATLNSFWKGKPLANAADLFNCADAESL